VPVHRSSEFQKIALIERALRQGGAHNPAVKLGIGDDAAVLASSGRLVWTIDSQVEGSHFDLRWLSLEDVGYRAFQAAASDLAAMGARPVAALSNLALPRSFSDAQLLRLARGQSEAAAGCRCPIIGGNLTRAPELSITTTLLGTVEKPLLRSGARAGDELWLWGEVGLAFAGLRALQRGWHKRAALRPCVERWRRPKALLVEGRKLVGRAHSALDISDGLAGDSAHLARASRMRVVFDAALLEAALAPELRRGAAALGEHPLALALMGGEDYALLASGGAARRPRGAQRVGYIERGSGVFLERGRARQRLGGSFEHFGKSG
jgi:thiamine-monophosphate kinase